MKKIILLFCLICSFCFVSCTNIKEDTKIIKTKENTKITKTNEVKNTASTVSYFGKIVDINDKSIMLADIKEKKEIYRCSIDNIEIFNQKGKKVNAQKLSRGMIIELEYDGTILETYPGVFENPSAIHIIDKEEDFVNFYLLVLEDLYKEDPALNDGISILAFDFTKVVNLRESEKAALIWLAGEKFGYETITGTFKELCEQGYINKKKLYFKTGLLLKIEDKKVKNNKFQFSAEKWRSGLGAYFFDDCTAKKQNGKWTYKIGSIKIS